MFDHNDIRIYELNDDSQYKINIVSTNENPDDAVDPGRYESYLQIVRSMQEVCSAVLVGK